MQRGGGGWVREVKGKRVPELKFRALSARSHGGRMCEISDAAQIYVKLGCSGFKNKFLAERRYVI